jgi:hypothetical protein
MKYANRKLKKIEKFQKKYSYDGRRRSQSTIKGGAPPTRLGALFVQFPARSPERWIRNTN